MNWIQIFIILSLFHLPIFCDDFLIKTFAVDRYQSHIVNGEYSTWDWTDAHALLNDDCERPFAFKVTFDL